MPIAEVRAAQVLRLNGVVRGHSGVRLEVVEALIRQFNAGFVPVVPQQGSVGASGDLAPLAHMAAAAMGAGEAFVVRGGQARRTNARDALAAIGEQPLEYAAKEGLALINGTEVMKAIGVLVALRARNLSKAADAIAALTIEGLLGSAKPFDDRLARLKGHAGHARCSDNVRACLANSDVLASHADCGRVQDPYSLRCVPQVHGAFKAALEHVTAILSSEINAVTDNPVLFPDTGEVVSAGQFHGQPVSMVLDYLALSLCTLANISERRIEQLVNPDLSHLPAFLTPMPGLHSGLMIAQVTAAALASENKSLAHPASVDTIPTSANQEDHVSMGVTAARKARAICDNVEHVLAIEWLCASQARDFNAHLRAGDGAQAAFELLRTRVPKLERDRFLHDDVRAAREMLADGSLVAAVERAVGPLGA
jgi:histidine ammonia-lyase